MSNGDGGDNRGDDWRSRAVLVYIVVLLTLQVFLLVVALEGFLADEESLAWAAAAMSLVFFAGALLVATMLPGNPYAGDGHD